jgi:hypothetical protein
MDAEAKKDLEWSEPIMVCRRHGQVRIDKILQSHCPAATTFKQVCPECETKLQIFH